MDLYCNKHQKSNTMSSSSSSSSNSSSEVSAPAPQPAPDIEQEDMCGRRSNRRRDCKRRHVKAAAATATATMTRGEHLDQFEDEVNLTSVKTAHHASLDANALNFDVREKRRQARMKRLPHRTAQGSTATTTSTSLTATTTSPQPGAVRVSNSDRIEIDADDDEPETRIVEAFAVDDGDPERQSSPRRSLMPIADAKPIIEPFWTRKRVVMAATSVVCFIVVLAICFSAYFGLPRGSSSSFEKDENNNPERPPIGLGVSLPTAQPSLKPTSQPTTESPSQSPSEEPTPEPSSRPSSSPTADPTPSPTSAPTPAPTPRPTPAPTFHPTQSPSDRPLAWIQMGNVLGLGGSDDENGYSVSLSKDGLLMAVGSPGTGKSVRVFRFGLENWKFVQKFSGLTTGYGTSVSLSDDGSTVAIGVSGPRWFEEGSDVRSDELEEPGRVEVYRLNAGTGRYELVESPLVGPAAKSEFGWAVSLSGDGKRVAAGARGRCFAQVYELDAGLTPVGPGVECVGADFSYGTAVKLSSDGNVAAIGSPAVLSADPNGEYDEEDLPGNVVVMKFDGAQWVQMGQTLSGEFRGDAFGTAVDLANNGMTIAIGAPLNDGDNGPNSIQGPVDDIDPDFGQVRVFDFDAGDNLWKQRGPDLDGAQISGHFGDAVALSSDGQILACGISNSNLNGAGSGAVGAYEWSGASWKLLGDFIPGQSFQAEAGSTLALSNDGTILSIGMPYAEGDWANSGLVKTFATGASSNGKGDTELTLRLEMKEYYERLTGWRVERLDAQGASGGQVQVASKPSYHYERTDSPAVETFKVQSGGVYRLFIFLAPSFFSPESIVTYGGSYALTTSEGAVLSAADYANSGQVTFAIGKLESVDVLNPGAKLMLVLDFKQGRNPANVHWIVKARWTSTHQDGRPRQATQVVGFGPPTAYFEDEQQQTELIDISMVPLAAIFSLTVIDTGRNGSAKYRLYDATNPDNVTLLAEQKEAFGRRAYHEFSVPSRR